jgi:hypothetical protein
MCEQAMPGWENADSPAPRLGWSAVPAMGENDGRASLFRRSGEVERNPWQPTFESEQARGDIDGQGHQGGVEKKMPARSAPDPCGAWYAS